MLNYLCRGSRPALVVILLFSAALSQAQNIQTIAGGGSFTNAPALSVPSSTVAVAVASNGSLYVSGDPQGRLIRVDPVTGIASALSSLDGKSLAADTAGNVYVVVMSSVYKVNTSTGAMDLVAGNGNYGDSGDNGPATQAAFSDIGQIAVDAAGNLYVPDMFTNRIRKVDATNGYVRTIAGSHDVGDDGDGGPALFAHFARPSAVAADAAGNVYIADTNNNRIRKISAADQTISTVAGTGMWGYNGDGLPALETHLERPSGLIVDAGGDLLVAQESGGRVRRVSASTGLVSTVAGDGSNESGGDGGSATSAQVVPHALALDAAGNLYIADTEGKHIRKVSAETGAITAVFGNGTMAFCGEGVLATNACLYAPSGVALDRAGDLLIADSYNSRIRKLSMETGLLTTIAGGGTASEDTENVPASSVHFGGVPFSVAVSDTGDIYFPLNETVRKIDSSGIISTVAGNGGYGSYGGDGGPATAASLNMPIGVALDAVGNLYIADKDNNRVRKVDAQTGVITTVAGTGSSSGALGDGGPATSASLNWPNAVVVDSVGNVYIADSSHFRVRKVDAATGIISTFAGTGVFAASGDGGPATAASISQPLGLQVDGLGNLYIATYPSRVRRVSVDTGVISTVTGIGAGFSGDGGPAANAYFNGPQGMAFDVSGSLYIADTYNDRIRKISVLAPPVADPTPPTITPVLSGPQGTNGWYVGNVSLEWSVVDSESAFTSQGCAATQVVQDTAGATFTCRATSAGGSSSVSVTVKRDATPPVISVDQPIEGYSYGFYQQATVQYSCADAISGATQCTGPYPNGIQLPTTSWGNRTDTIRSKDAAGNAATKTVHYTVARQFTFDGVLAPVANAPTLNVVPRGRLVALKWRLPDGNGGFTSQIASFNSLTTTSVACPSGPLNPVTEQGTGGVGLRYDAPTSTFIYNWSSGSTTGCRKVVIKLLDNVTHEIRFKVE